MDWLIKDITHIWQVLAASVLILVFVVLVIRVAGLRTLSKMTSFDFAVTIAIGSVLGASATGSVTLTQGAVAIFALVLTQACAAMLMRKSSGARKALSNSPLLIMDGETILRDNMKHVRMAESELFAKLREANVLTRSQVRAVILESTGDVSVLHSCDANEQVEEWILNGVRRTP